MAYTGLQTIWVKCADCLDMRLLLQRPWLLACSCRDSRWGWSECVAGAWSAQ